MTPAQLQSVLEEISEWSLQDRRAYIANLAMLNSEEAEQVKDGLKKIWEAKSK